MNKILVFMGIILTVLVVGSFYIGAWYSCNQGQGTLSGLKCINIINLGTCKNNNINYVVPKEYYMEITEDGLNKTILTKEGEQFVSTGKDYQGDLI